MILIPVLLAIVLIPLGLASKSKKNIKSMDADQQRQADEIVTVILLTINNDK
jgi:hypothetical protein